MAIPLKQSRLANNSEKMSRVIKARNFLKHVRIANATTGHERDVHLEKAQKLQIKYKL